MLIPLLVSLLPLAPVNPVGNKLSLFIHPLNALLLGAHLCQVLQENTDVTKTYIKFPNLGGS